MTEEVRRAGKVLIPVRVSGTNGPLLAIIGASTISFSAIFVREANVSPSTAAIFRCLYALPALGALTLFERPTAAPDARRRRAIAAVAGGFLAVDLIAWHHSIADVGAGLATVLGNAQVAVVPVVAWLLHRERPPRRMLAMLPVSILGIVLLSGVVGRNAYGRHPLTGAMFGAVTAVTYSIFILLLRMASSRHANTVEPLFIATGTATIMATMIGILVGDAALVPTWSAHVWLILLALTSQVLGWILITSSLPDCPRL